MLHVTDPYTRDLVFPLVYEREHIFQGTGVSSRLEPFNVIEKDFDNEDATGAFRKGFFWFIANGNVAEQHRIYKMFT